MLPSWSPPTRTRVDAQIAGDRHDDRQGAVLIADVILNHDTAVHAGHLPTGRWREVEPIHFAALRIRTGDLGDGRSSAIGHVSCTAENIVSARRRSSVAMSR
jgi:hypothetical protein